MQILVISPIFLVTLGTAVEVTNFQFLFLALNANFEFSLSLLFLVAPGAFVKVAGSFHSEADIAVIRLHRGFEDFVVIRLLRHSGQKVIRDNFAVAMATPHFFAPEHGSFFFGRYRFLKFPRRDSKRIQNDR